MLSFLATSVLSSHTLLALPACARAVSVLAGFTVCARCEAGFVCSSSAFLALLGFSSGNRARLAIFAARRVVFSYGTLLSLELTSGTNAALACTNGLVWNDVVCQNVSG